jgi:hypothetical protein
VLKRWYEFDSQQFGARIFSMRRIATLAVLCVCFFVFLAHELGINELMLGNPINVGPIAIASFISFWILRKESVLGDESSLGMLDRIFKKIFGRY